jgi:hypothetical protein
MNTSIIPVTLSNGSVLPFRHYESSAGNDCYGILGTKANGERYFSKYGVNVTADVTGDLSEVDSLTVLDKTIPVTSAQEPKKDSKTGNDIPGTERLVLRASGKVKVNGREKEFSLRITDRGEAGSNVGGSINGKRGGTGAPAVTAL